MKAVYAQFSENDFVATLYAEAIMNLHAWNFFVRKGGAPQPWTPELLQVIERAMTINPKNPLANHLYLHATEAGSDFDKALRRAPGAHALAYLYQYWRLSRRIDCQ
jgi:hypothetical protein